MSKLASVGSGSGRSWTDEPGFGQDPNVLRDLSLQEPWQPYLFEEQPNFKIVVAAEAMSLNPRALAQELIEAQEILKSLLIVPLLGSRQGFDNSHMYWSLVQPLLESPVLMQVPEIREFVVAINEGVRAVSSDSAPYTNANTLKFLFLRQQLEDRLVDCGVTQRIYDVRPAYHYTNGAYPDTSRFNLGDHLQFSIDKSSAIRCRVLSQAYSTDAEHCMLCDVAISETSIPALAGSQKVVIGRFDFTQDTTMPLTTFGRQVLEPIFQHIRANSLSAQAAYFITYLPESAASHEIAHVRLGIFSPRVVDIFPHDPSELAILKAAQRREHDLACRFEGRSGFLVSDKSPKQVLVARGFEGGAPFELIRSSAEPFFQRQSRLPNGSISSKALSVQDWVQALNTCSKSL